MAPLSTPELDPAAAAKDRSDGPDAGQHPRSSDALTWLCRAAYFILAIQLVVLLIASVRLYDRYNMTRDFAIYHQSWWLIAHGHLNPFDSVDGFPFIKSHFELIIWPLSLLYWVHHSGVTLLWVQDLALVGSEIVAFGWARDALRRHEGRGLPVVAALGALVVVLVITPGFYATAWDDFHSQSLATLFALLAARDLYNGKVPRAALWVGLTLLCGDVAGTYVIGLGCAAALSSRRTRPIGIAMVVVGVVWVFVIGALGDNMGSSLTSGYGYLVSGLRPGQAVTLAAILGGIVHHPSVPIRILHERFSLILHNLRSGGVIGALSPWVLFLVVVVVAPNALEFHRIFITTAFQNLVLYLFVPVGSILVLDWLARLGNQANPDEVIGSPDRAVPGWRASAHRFAAIPLRVRPTFNVARASASGLAVIILAATMAFSVPQLRTVKMDTFAVSPETAQTLASAQSRIRGNDEVVASQGVMGRYADRPAIYELVADKQTFPVSPGVPVIFVLVPSSGVELTTPAGVQADITRLAKLPNVRTLSRSPSATVLAWTPSPRAHTVSLPTAKIN